MPLPLLAKLGGAALAYLFFSGGHKEPVPSPTSMPVSERMARVLQTGDPNAIRFEAGRLRQEGHPSEAAELERAAATLEAEIAAGHKPAPVYPSGAPPAAGNAGPVQPSVGPLPAGAVTSPGFVPPVIPAGLVLPLPLLGANEVLHYMPPPAPYDPRVQAWQTKLLSLGISVGPDGADGKFGDNTRTATTTFQKRANEEAKKTGQPQISVNGMLDAPTLARAALIFPMPKPTATTKPPATTTKPPAPAPAPPILLPQPMPAAPPIVVQTPAGPMQIPSVLMPQPAAPPVVVQTPAGPMQLPPIVMPQQPSAPPVVVMPSTQMPVALPALVPLPLPSIAKGQPALKPSQTKNSNVALVQNKLISLGFLKQADVPASQLGIYGPKTTAAVKAFQTAANNYLKSSKQSFILPHAGVTLNASKLLTVDGEWGPQTNDVAALAHPANTAGALWGSPFGASPIPRAASPLPGVIPPMSPQGIDPRVQLAARLLDNLHSNPAQGSEDRSLVQQFQAMHGLRASGYYNPETAMTLARCGFIPPAPRYWPAQGRSKARNNYRQAIRQLGKGDPQRREEWELAARSAA